MNTGRLLTSQPIAYRFGRDGVIYRYERLSDGRLRRLIEDEGRRPEVFVHTDYAQIEMRLLGLGKQ